MKPWQYLRWSVIPGFRFTYDKLHDEERLELETDSEPKHRRQSSWDVWPTKATGWLFLLMINLAIVALLLHTLEPLITLLRLNEQLFSPRVTLPSPSVSYVGNGTAQSNRIPLILHQTTATEEIPERWIQPQQSCKKAYREFEYKLWTDESARNFLSKHYSWFVPIWDNYAFPIQRADSIRYFVLYHYGGIYLDMDTVCNNTIPLHKLGSPKVKDYALFKSTHPTGITNDLLVASARHPIYASAISKLPAYNALTTSWARLQPYCAIMISAGPLFLTMMVKDYLLDSSALHSKAAGVVNQTELAPYITDLQSSSWHRADAQMLMWIGERPWLWFTMGAFVLLMGLYIVDRLLLLVYAHFRKVPSDIYGIKLDKKA